MNTKVAIFIFLLITTFNQAIAVPKSNAYCDSLLDIINLSENPKQQVDEYIILVRFYQMVDTKRALDILTYANKVASENKLDTKLCELDLIKRQCQVISADADIALFEIDNVNNKLEKYNSSSLWGEYYLLQALYCKQTDDVIKAFDYCLNALGSFKKSNDKYGLARVYKCIGDNYYYYGDNGKAIQYYKLSEKQALKTDNSILLGEIYSRIGVLYCKFDDLDNSDIYYKKADSIYREYDLEYFMAELFSNMAVLNMKKKNIVDAIKQNQAAIYYSLKNDNKKIQGETYNNLGYIYLQLNRIDSAKHYLLKSLEVYEILGDKAGLARVYFSFSELYFKTKEYVNATRYMTHAYHYSQNIGDMELSKDAVIFLAKIEAEAGNYKFAYEYNLIANEIADSIQKSANSNCLQSSKGSSLVRQKMYLYEEQIGRDALADIIKNEEERNLYSFFIIVTAIIVIFIFFVILRIKFRKKHIAVLEDKAKEREKHSALLEISNIEIMEQYAFIETLLNTIPSPVFYTDKRNRLLGCNNAFEEISNATADELAGVSMDKIRDRSSIEMLGENIFEKNDVGLNRCEGKVRFNDGVEHYVFCYRKGIIDGDGDFIGSVGILNDFSELKTVQDSLLKSEERLKDALSSKDKFFNIVAHDLKNPFHGVLGLTMFLTDNYSSLSVAEIKKNIKNINKSATQVYNLLENLLDWARAQSGLIKIQTARFLINDPIDDSIQLLKILIDKKDIKIKFDHVSDLKVRADKNMILVVVRNILSNAIKYTHKGGEVTISINSIDGFAQLSIKDNGVGISQERINKLLHIDKPVSTPGVDNEKGTGLGLIICQEFVKLNGGEIVINSKQGEGSEFLVSIPLG